MKYGGQGTAPLDTDQNWYLPGEAAVLLAPQPLPPRQPTQGGHA